MKNKNKDSRKKSFFEKLKVRISFAAALFMSVFFCIESISNGNLNAFDWTGISVSAIIIVWWILCIGIFINRKKTEKENKKLEEIKNNLAKQPDPDADLTSDEY